MPRPRQGETKSKFMERCMSDPEAKKTAPGQMQRVMLCKALWEKGRKR